MFMIIQRCTTRNQRICFLLILICCITVILLIRRTHVQPVIVIPDESTRPPLINFDGIIIDHDRLLQEKITSYKHSAATNQLNKTWQEEIQKFFTHVSPFFQNQTICVNYWVVIIDYSENVIEVAKRLPDWCIVLILEREEINAKLTDNIFILNSTIQYEFSKLSLFYKESLTLPKDLYSVRKNLGYLWAIYHQAVFIWDYDSYNDLIANQSFILRPLNQTMEILTLSNYNSTLFNPYDIFTTKYDHICSRGYPFRTMKEKVTNKMSIQLTRNVWSTKNLALINVITEGYADVGFGYLLVKPDLPIHLKNFSNNTDHDLIVVIPRRTFSPYDQQTTFHFRSALWSLFMPVTVHQQVTDIYRSYIMQRLMWDVELQIAFSGSLLMKRHVQGDGHEGYLLYRKGDSTRQIEKAVFWKIDDLIQFLTQWSNKSKNFLEHIEQLFFDLQKHDYIKMVDVYLLHIWLQELHQIGYIFPQIVS